MTRRTLLSSAALAAPTATAWNDLARLYNWLHAAIAVRLSEITRYWLSAAQDVLRPKVHTATGQHLSCGITAISIDGLTAAELRAQLLEKHRTLSMVISRYTSEFSGVRISPASLVTAAISSTQNNSYSPTPSPAFSSADFFLS